uniref:Uncharacterized protein n=1 Tax=Siphoviridae sp. ctss15 TaxID=2825699 RepID=A0A8S5TRA7_9CAUD|nr:MAG TPA: hypothetical protein [Siphoviridae sp. ctss15]DAP24096.1 MAG TPA: hypothetical protein [Caudoviricetes sp.]DAP41258.1 MAG TPA: hypothetical protein [Caudoviricetes sp.]DAZ55743.1 MAG TPA: hypothetical protein [Caudoviricetes sp.]
MGEHGHGPYPLAFRSPYGARYITTASRFLLSISCTSVADTFLLSKLRVHAPTVSLDTARSVSVETALSLLLS